MRLPEQLIPARRSIPSQTQLGWPPLSEPINANQSPEERVAAGILNWPLILLAGARLMMFLLTIQIEFSAAAGQTQWRSREKIGFARSTTRGRRQRGIESARANANSIQFDSIEFNCRCSRCSVVVAGQAKPACRSKEFACLRTADECTRKRPRRSKPIRFLPSSNSRPPSTIYRSIILLSSTSYQIPIGPLIYILAAALINLPLRNQFAQERATYLVQMAHLS